MSRSDTTAVQHAYAHIHAACHAHLSADHSILAYLDLVAPTRPEELAEQLETTPAKLMKDLQRLAKSGLVKLTGSVKNKSEQVVRLTAKGDQALASAPMLDDEAIETALKSLSPADRRTVVEGLRLFAEASSALMHEH